MKNLGVNILLVFAFLGFVHEAQSQDVGVSWGEAEKLKKRHYGKEILLDDEERLYMMERKSNDVNLLFFTIRRSPDLFVQVFDTDSFSIENSVQLRLPKKEGAHYTYKVLKMLKVEGKRLLFLKAKDEKAGTVKLLVQQIDDQGRQMGKILEVDETTIDGGIGLFSQTKEGDFDIVLNPSKTKFAVLRVDPFDEEQQKQVHLKILNDSVGLEWSGSIDLPYKEEFFELKHYAFNDANEVFLLGKVFQTEERQSLGGKTRTRVIRPKEGSPNYKYSFFVFRTQNLQAQEFDLSLPGKFVTDINFSFANDPQQIRLAGFYSKKWGTGIGGTFSTCLNHQTNKVVYSHLKDFSPEFLRLFGSDRSYEESKERGKYYAELSDFRMDDFIVKKDGSSYLVAENYYVVVNTSTIRDQYGYDRTTTSYTYHYDDLIVLYMSPEGTVEWSAKIPKKQMSYNDDGPYSSYLLNVEDDRISLIFNDHEDNASRYKEGKDPRNMGNPKRSVTTCVSINNDGKLVWKELFRASEERIVFRPKSSWYARDIYQSHRIYIFGVDYGLFRRTKFKMGAFDFPTP